MGLGYNTPRTFLLLNKKLLNHDNIQLFHNINNNNNKANHDNTLLCHTVNSNNNNDNIQYNNLCSNTNVTPGTSLAVPVTTILPLITTIITPTSEYEYEYQLGGNALLRAEYDILRHRNMM